MKILTLNAWGAYGPPERRPVLREALAQLDADVVCLQEANVPGLLESLPYPTRLQFPEAGLAILSRFPSRSHRQSAYRAVSPLENHCRGALLAQLETDGSVFWVVSTHLAWKADDGTTRLAQVEELLELLAGLPDPVLVGGDFNATTQEPAVTRMVAGRFTDLHARLAPGRPGITWDNRNPFIQSHSVRFPDRRIDYLFLRGTFSGLQPVRCEVACSGSSPGGLYPSDHYGVLARFQP